MSSGTRPAPDQGATASSGSAATATETAATETAADETAGSGFPGFGKRTIDRLDTTSRSERATPALRLRRDHTTAYRSAGAPAPPISLSDMKSCGDQEHVRNRSRRHDAPRHRAIADAMPGQARCGARRLPNPRAYEQMRQITADARRRLGLSTRLPKDQAPRCRKCVIMNDPKICYSFPSRCRKGSKLARPAEACRWSHIDQSFHSVSGK